MYKENTAGSEIYSWAGSEIGLAKIVLVSEYPSGRLEQGRQAGP